VRRASQRLHLTQPPLSRQIQGLEDELGARLFARERGGMRLLPEGERFLAHARRILDEVDAARAAFTPRDAGARDLRTAPRR
jgi:DNA-binding transcriptional LysR family regulator